MVLASCGVTTGPSGPVGAVQQEQEEVVRVEGLTKVFGWGRTQVTAVDNVSFSIRKGEIISLLGESGSGKTTIARLILHLARPTRGTVLFRGKDIFALRGRRELVSYWGHVQTVFQDPFASFNNFSSVRRILRNAFRVAADPPPPQPEAREDAMRRALGCVGLNPDEVLDRRAHELSGGQRQRIMIARVLLINPEVLVADEPTSMIDASSRASILSLLVDLQKECGMSILFITHDIGLAYYTSDRLLIMKQGRIVEQGAAEEIVDNPRDPYTKRLMEDVPVLHRRWEF